MNKYNPHEAVSQLKDWIEKCISDLDQDTLQEAKERYTIVVDTIKNIDKLNMTLPDDLVLEKEMLEEAIQTETVLKDLQFEFASLVKLIKQSLPKKRKLQTDRKSPPKTLSVTFFDGTMVCEKNATTTFLRSLERIGLERISDLLNIRSHGHPLVSKQKNKASGSPKVINEFYIETHSSTETKAKYLRTIARQLHEDIKIDIS